MDEDNDLRGSVTEHLELANAVAVQWCSDKAEISGAVHAAHIALHLLKAAFELQPETAAILAYLAEKMEGEDTAKILNSTDVFARSVMWNVSDAVRLCVLLPAASSQDREQHLETLLKRVVDADGLWKGVTNMSMPGGQQLIAGVYQ